MLVAATLGIACAAGANAACDTGLAERMHAQLHPKRTLDHERAACQPWRGVPGRYIVVLPLPRTMTDPTAEPDEAEFDLEVLVVQQADNGNTDRARIVSRVFEETALREDAIRIVDIKIDAARYNLAKDVRAFGVRVSYQGSSRVAPYANETLTLYVPQGGKLVKVLDALETTIDSGEWDTNCAGIFGSIRGTVSIGPNASNGYADLILRESHVETRSSLQGDECVTRERPTTFNTETLRFDGAMYRMLKRRRFG